MKKLVFIVIALLLLAAGGVGGGAMLGKGPLAPMFAKYRAKAPPPPPPKDKVMTVGTYVIPIIRDHVIRRQVGMDIDIDVNGTAVDKVDLLMPRLQQLFLVTLYDIVPRHSDTRSSVDRDVIHDQLVKAAAQAVGEGAVRDVVIKSIYDR